MATKKTTKKKEDKVKWDDVESVAPATTTKPKVAPEVEPDTVPFGGMNKVEEIIRAYRKHVVKNAIPKNGVAKAPDGVQYHYYLTEDVLAHADAFCEAKGGFLQSWMEATEGSNVMKLTLEHTASGQVKQVSADLGRPSSMADFGGRITYAPKYLVAMLFGISVQTDTDAYHNGTVKSDNQTNDDTKKSEGENDAKGGSGRSDSTPSNSGGSSTSSPDNGDSESGSDAKVDAVESASFKAAKAFIEKSYSDVMLNEAETKLANSQKLTDDEKEVLASLISQKREDIQK